MPFFKELSEEFSKVNTQKYHHAHLYYICGIVALTLFFFSVVQAVIMHLDGITLIALLEYFISVLLLVISIRCFSRGKVHYKYPQPK
jgi:hypothetical protein